MTTTITADLVMSWHPCEKYTRERVEELCGGKALSVSDVLSLPIPGADRLWVVLREGMLPDSVYREFAAMCADIALTAERDAGREPDPRSWAAVDVALRHAAGMATDEELAAARDAARDAAWAAARAAARAAAWDAARDAARDAAWAAAWDAARAAARDAARDAAWDAAWAAARAAARAAAWAAARDAARDAAWAAAWDAANDQWCELLLALLGERGIE
jgi:hypothetical protein